MAQQPIGRLNSPGAAKVLERMNFKSYDNKNIKFPQTKFDKDYKYYPETLNNKKIEITSIKSKHQKKNLHPQYNYI